MALQHHEQQLPAAAAAYAARSSGLFPRDSAHHAAEQGDVSRLAAVAAQQLAALGYPALVTLQAPDAILQCTPLHVAAEAGHEDAVAFLLGQGVDPDATDGHGVRPLQLAAVTNRLAVAERLMDAGANPTKQSDHDGDTPALWAARKGHVQVQWLMTHAVVAAHSTQAAYIEHHTPTLTTRCPPDAGAAAGAQCVC